MKELPSNEVSLCSPRGSNNTVLSRKVQRRPIVQINASMCRIQVFDENVVRRLAVDDDDGAMGRLPVSNCFKRLLPPSFYLSPSKTDVMHLSLHFS